MLKTEPSRVVASAAVAVEVALDWHDVSSLQIWKQHYSFSNLINSSIIIAHHTIILYYLRTNTIK